MRQTGLSRDKRDGRERGGKVKEAGEVVEREMGR